MPGKLTTKTIHLIRRVMALYKDRKKDFHMAFINLEKAYDRVPREVLWRCLEKKGVSVAYIQVIKDMNEGIKMIVRTFGRDTNEFPVDIRLHQASALSLFLFACVMDELPKRIQDEALWYMLFANDIILIDETRDEVNIKLEQWRRASESRGFKFSGSKTKHLRCSFSGGEEDNREVTIDGVVIPSIEKFIYLGSII